MGAPLSRLGFFALMTGAALLLLVVLCLLPHDRYLRFLSLTDQQVVKAGWMYERIHFDRSPIDVVFLGTSHSVFGIDSAEVERVCHAEKGTHCASVNFALQHLGRDLHWLMAREVLEARKPRLLIIEVQESEPRAMHPVFSYLADAGDVAGAPVIINTGYFSNLARLPLRQMSLAARTVAPGLFGARTAFVPALYRGTHWDDTYLETGSPEHPIVGVAPRTDTHPAEELEYERAHPQGGNGAAPKLPASLRGLEYRATLAYLDDIVALAREKGVPVRFLYMPSFRVTAMPDFADYYQKAAPLWQMPDVIRQHPEYWLDVGHLNAAGAAEFSRWLGAKIARDGTDSVSASRESGG